MRLHERDINQDVRDLGTLLGDIIKTQASPAGFETIETLRTAAIAYRRGDVESCQEIVDLVSTLPPDRMSTVDRAFTSYFELINLAEERERVRHIRASMEEDSLGDGLDTTIATLAASDLSADTAPRNAAGPTHSAKILTTLFNTRAYAQALNNREQVHDITLRLFHGRGGSISRGEDP